MNRIASIGQVCAVIAVTKRMLLCRVFALLWLAAGLAWPAHALEPMRPAPLPGEPARLAKSSAAPPASESTQRLEQDLAQLRAEQAAAQAQLLELRQQLDQARRERFGLPLLFALLLGVLALGSSTFYFWRSRRKERADREWLRLHAQTDPGNTIPCVEALAAPVPAFTSARGDADIERWPGNTVAPGAAGAFAYEEKTMEWASILVEEPSGLAEMRTPLNSDPQLDNGTMVPDAAPAVSLALAGAQASTPHDLKPGGRRASETAADEVDLYLPLDTFSSSETQANSTMRHLDISLDDPTLGRPSVSKSPRPVKQAW